MADEVEDIITTLPFRFTEKDSLALMEILMLRGYFHERMTPSDGLHHTYSKDDALLMETQNGCYITTTELRKRFIDLLIACGRMSILESAELLNVSSETIQRVVISSVVERDNFEKFIVVTSPNGLAREVLSSDYIDDQIDSLWSILLGTAESGKMLVSDVAASFFHLPVDLALQLLEKRCAADDASTEVHILLTDNAAKALVTEGYLNLFRTKFTALLNDALEPINIKSLAKTNGWEVNWVLQIIKKVGFDVRGEFHGDMFVPNIFIENQRRLVASSYSMNGFVTYHTCHAMHGISTSQMKAYVTTDKVRESYILLPNSVVNIDVVVAPLVEAARLAMESTSWLDLKLHLPMELLENETDDARLLVENFVLSDDISGVASIRSDGALFFSKPMIKAFVDGRLTSLISEMAILRAIELLRLSEPDMPPVKCDISDVDGSSTTTTLSGKEKRKGRKSGKDFINQGVDISSDDIGEIPINGVVEALVEMHPELSNLESSADILSWTCQEAFFTDNLESLWKASVRFEVERLRAADNKSASGSTGTGPSAFVAHNFKSIEAAFEDPGCFASSCYMVQAKAKFLLHALQSSDRISDEMKHQLTLEFFDGCCLDFVYRLTRYALNKKNVEDGIFKFGSAVGIATSFYDPVDLGSSSYPKIYLSCVSKRNDALTVLQEELPGGVGLALAKLWTPCSESHRERSLTEANRNKVDVGLEQVELFLSNLRENCLSVCGLPFSILDKKTEKKFLNLRRIRLTQLLDNASDLATALDYAIMIQYQNCKNMVVSGSLLRGPVLKLLATERKVPEALSKELVSLAERIEQGEEGDLLAFARLKELTTSSTKVHLDLRC